jgi:hydrogenase small subunit
MTAGAAGSPSSAPPARPLSVGGSRPVSVLWLTSGLSCDGDSFSLTAATSPSLEDLLRGCFPGMPPVLIYNPVLAYESGDEFMRLWFEAAEGQLEPFILVLEGSVPNENISGEGYWATFGLDRDTGEPIPCATWIDRLAPQAAAVLAMGTCAAYGGIPAMRNNPTGAMGLRDYLGWDWSARSGLPIVNLPGCPVQPDNITETLLSLVLYLAGISPAPELDEQGRPVRLFGRTAHESCDRAGLAEHGEFSETHGDGRCLVKLGCKGPVVKCNVPIRGWVNGIGGCPNVGGICMACTMPGFPDKYLPFMQPDSASRLYTRAPRVSYGPALKYLRERRIRRSYDVEPDWRRPSDELESGYEPPWIEASREAASALA